MTTSTNHVTRLIVNADDFGLSAGVNAGVIVAHAGGIVTSASLMVRQAGTISAVELSRRFPELSVGLHFDLGEWCYRDGDWQQLYEIVPLHDPPAIRDELRRQLDRFHQLLGRGPTHLDSHQHVHRDEPVDQFVREMGDELNVPVRHFCSGVQYCGDFYGQYGNGEPVPESLAPERLVGIISRLPPGTVELACHPGFDDRLATMYCKERRREVETLCDPRVRQAASASQIALISYSQLASMGHAA
jgi:predicted glycoside hydrolase/deacetylase ChbG (UPF0249 family)